MTGRGTHCAARLELWALVGRLRAQRTVPARLKVEAADAALRISALLAGTDAGRPPVRLGRGQAQAIIVELLDALTGAGIAWQDIVADVTTYRQARPAPIERETVHA